MTLVDTSGRRASDRKIIRKALVDSSEQVAPSTNVRDSSDYTRIRRLVEKNKKMKRDASN